MDPKLIESLHATFPAAGAALTLGAPVHEGECLPEPRVSLPLALMNRHGLIAGATGTGKTKSLQLLAEQLSTAGVPVFVSDVKGDLSGLGAAGEASARVTERGAQTATRGAGRDTRWSS